MKMLSLDRREKQGSGHKGLGAVLFCLIVVIGSVLSAHAHACAAQFSLIWDPSGDSDVVGYNVYYGTQSGHYTTEVNAGNTTTYTVSNLQAGSTYYFAVTAYDSYGYESAYSNEVASTAGGDSGGGGGGGGGCFIATAAFGSYLDPHVAVLRSFRDSFLLTNRLGKALVSWYYATSPPYADTIRQNGPLKTVVRIALFPPIGFAYLCLAVGVVPALLMAVAFLAGLAWGARRLSVCRPRSRWGNLLKA
jgi:hypothetical protein